MAKGSDSQVVTVDGHRLTVSNLAKVIYPETGTTKGDVLGYFAAIAPVMLPHVAWRPATRKRWVHGVGTTAHPEQPFFQKDLEAGAPDWVKRQDIQHKDHVNVYPLVNNLATLTWLGQLAALEIHVPQWRFTRSGTRKNPDRFVIDLDPGDGVGLRECAEVARLARAILQGMGMDPVPVTSGSKGIHLYAALDGTQTSDEVSAVAHELARALEADHPDMVVSDMKKTLRTGKVLIDWSQNNGSKTTIAPYSLRGRARPTVAVPRTWAELASPQLRQLEYQEVVKRVAKRGDPMASLLEKGSAGHLTDPNDADAEPERDSLHLYRQKRDASKTPEPVPASVSSSADGNSFVIQEHHASRLHYDFRLERDGVLASWAVPKGVPETAGRNHLAVEVEDHPLEYGKFEGVIPRGEYGAGTVEIWDSGTYDLEKWRDDEIIVTLHGMADGGLGGGARLALIRTTGKGEKSQWLLHRMKDQATKWYQPPSRKTRAGAATAAATIAPMLATLGDVDHLPEDTDLAIEMKWDGIRAVATITDGTVRLTSRNGVDLTARFPEFADLASLVDASSAVLDGEIVALDARGRPNFGRLQQRTGLTKPAEIEAVARDVVADYYLFDVMRVDDADLTDHPYDDRRQELEHLIKRKRGSRISVPAQWRGSIGAAMASSKRRGLEGIVLKDRDGEYEPGRRSTSWLKLKHAMTQEVVIGGWRPGNGSRADGIGSLLMGVPGEDGLEYVGRVGTGFTNRELDSLLALLAPLARKTPALVGVPAIDASDAHWVRPTVVGEVTFAEWTDTGRLRQPSWRGLRSDKDPEDVVRES